MSTESWPSSARPNASALLNRCSGSFEVPFKIIPSSSSLISLQILRGRGSGSLIAFSITAMGVSAEKGCEPVSISNSTIESE